MTGGDVPDLMAEDRGQRRFALEVDEETAGDGDEAAGEGEGIGAGVVNHAEFPGEFGAFAEPGQAPADLLDIAVELGIGVDPAHLLHRLGKGLAPDADLFVGGDGKEGEFVLAGDGIDGAGSDEQKSRQQNTGKFP